MENVGIYTIICSGNSKIYVGSSTHLKRRLCNHKNNLLNNCHPNRHLQSSFNKYGKESFKFEVLDFCDAENILWIEKYWITILNAKFNINCPINQFCNSRSVDVYNINREYIKSFSSIQEASYVLNIDSSSISKICKRKLNYIHGLTFRYKDEALGNLQQGRGRKVNQYSLDNKFIKTWNSAAEACRFFNCDSTSIQKACSRKEGSSVNFKWKYYE